MTFLNIFAYKSSFYYKKKSSIYIFLISSNNNLNLFLIYLL